MLYGAAVWDPILIIAQIVSLQCLFYISLGMWEAVFLSSVVGRLNISHVLGWRHLDWHSYEAWMAMLANTVNATVASVFIMWLVERAKKCLDFASTCYMFHMIFTWWLFGFPASLAWWSTNVVGLLIMSLLGEWLCVRREMADIPLGSLRARAAAGLTSSSSSSGGVQLAALEGSRSARVSESSRLLGGAANV